jgi:hypothetical protein
LVSSAEQDANNKSGFSLAFHVLVNALRPTNLDESPIRSLCHEFSPFIVINLGTASRPRLLEPEIEAIAKLFHEML